LNHLHFKTIQSTQDYLRQQEANKAEDTIISCDQQTQGHGQRSNKWDADENTLCLSFTLEPNEQLSLTSLEVGVLLTQYFSQNHAIELKLKWPNDILTSNREKVAGILIHNANDRLIVGVGINYFKRKQKVINDKYHLEYGHLFEKSFELDKMHEAHKIVTFIKKNRISATDVIQKWNNHCIHLNQKISLVESELTTQGEFIGIGAAGEALIKTSNKINKFYTGSIRF
jgi:BirA family transcriptional regulator, biotin operon repressor / biotin---[acetyl-CoA-carboxylase] ligase